MTKLISAQTILKEKGFVQNKFDTNGFMQAVGQYFLENSIESKLLLIPSRFIEIDKEVYIEGKTYKNPLEITDDDIKVGYKVQTEMDKKYPQWAAWLIDLNKRNADLTWAQVHLDISYPRIIIDKPFFENAAATLRLMGGYVVEKQMKKRQKRYWVTLI